MATEPPMNAYGTPYECLRNPYEYLWNGYGMPMNPHGVPMNPHGIPTEYLRIPWDIYGIPILTELWLPWNSTYGISMNQYVLMDLSTRTYGIPMYL